MQTFEDKVSIFFAFYFMLFCLMKNSNVIVSIQWTLIVFSFILYDVDMFMVLLIGNWINNQ